MATEEERFADLVIFPAHSTHVRRDSPQVFPRLAVADVPRADDLLDLALNEQLLELCRQVVSPQRDVEVSQHQYEHCAACTSVLTVASSKRSSPIGYSTSEQGGKGNATISRRVRVEGTQAVTQALILSATDDWLLKRSETTRFCSCSPPTRSKLDLRRSDLPHSQNSLNHQARLVYVPRAVSTSLVQI